MQEQESSLDRKRRVHLGILRSELQSKSYEKFFRWEMGPLPESVDQALVAGAVDPVNGVAIEDINRLLEPGYLALETGYTRFTNGIVHVATLTQFPGASSEMIDWWFGWHGIESERYKLWHPQAHLFSQMRYDRAERSDLTDRQKYIGNTSYVDEYVGPNILPLAITFHEPRDFGFDEARFKDAGIGTAVCARVGFSNRPVDSGHVVHLMRDTAEGCEMRSRFWLGDVHVRGLPEGNPVDRVLAQPFLREKLVPLQYGRDLLIHCAEEMNHLASFLPSLYTREAAD
jgi:hypothetical protein